MKRIIFISGCIIFWLNVNSQQIPTYSQYTENLFLFNPAVAGSEQRSIFCLNNRLQWLGMKDAPKTSTFTAQGNLGKARKFKIFKAINNSGNSGKRPTVGLGGMIYNDRNTSLLQQTGAQLAYAYHIPLRGSTQFSMGLALSAFQARLDKSLVLIKDPGDPTVAAAKSAYVVDASAGALLTNREFFVGLSALQISSSILNLGDKISPKLRHYYLFGGYFFDISSHYTICPSVLSRMTDKPYTFQTDFSCKFIYMDAFWAGFSYRTNKEAVFFAGICQNKMYVTYSFDYVIKPLRQPSWGSHELTLAYKMERPRKNRGIAR